MPSKTTPSQDQLGFQGEGFDWNEYIKYRPAYPASFYNRLYDEHAKNLNSFGTINDIGAGAGVASGFFAEKFKKVIVSEPNARYVKIAEERLTKLPNFPKDKFSFLQEGCEQSSLPDSSVDCITICEALHWADIPTSVNEFARVLKSGGTLGIFHYSIPDIVDDPALNSIWRGLVYKSAGGRFALEEVYTRAFKNLQNAYQNIYFDPKIWKAGVRRIYVNTNGDLMNVGIHTTPPPGEKISEQLVELVSVPAENNVGKTDVEEFIENDKDWEFEVDVGFLKNIFENMIIGKEEEFRSHVMKTLNEAIGDRKVTIRYPAYQLIATRL